MRILVGLLIAGLSFSALADVKPKVAVTDLAYEERVREYINVVDSTRNTNIDSTRDGRSRDYSNHSKTDYHKVEGTYSYINQTELRRFVGDIKGEIKKDGLLDLIQGRPYSGDPDFDNVHDIIARIDQGDFDGADYVLFGRVSDIQFADNVTNIQHTNTYSKSLSLTVVGEFSLIDTKTLEIKAAFTASGEAKEMRLINSLDKKVTLNRAKLVRDVSKSLGIDVANQVAEQLTGRLPDDEYNPPVRHNLPADEPPTIIRRK